jgi:ABC-2 type transport system permease protein
MSKITTIITREYTSRVKKKSFLIMTFLTPLLFVLVIFLPVWMSQNNISEKQNIAIIDESSFFIDYFANTEKVQYTYFNVKPDSLFNFMKDMGFTAIVVIPENFKQDSIHIFSEKQVPLEIKSQINALVNSKVETQNLLNKNIDPQVLVEAKENIPIQAMEWSKDGETKKTEYEVNMAIGFAAALIIYMFIFMYGAQLMRGTMEEKSGRIVEILASSVKPFEMLMGKIIGIAFVAFTQFGIWLLTILTVFFVGKTVLATESPEILSVLSSFQNIHSILWFLVFVFYFIGGYLFYGSLFAAVGAAVDNETDTQQFMLPITLPLVLAFIFAQSIITNPDGQIAMWLSLIPFTSPLVMIVRLGFGVPMWQLIVSIILLICTFVFSTYIASKIYRIGILSYGKKITYGDLWKWIRYKN